MVKVPDLPVYSVLEITKEVIPDDLWGALVDFSLPHMTGRKDFEHHPMTAVYEAISVAQAAVSEGKFDYDPTIEVVIFAFLHDLGYDKLANRVDASRREGITPQAKADHQQLSAQMAQQFFDANQNAVKKYLSPKRQQQLVEIIRVHDEPPTTPLHQLCYEVDTLASIDMMFGRPSFTKPALVKWLDSPTGPIAKRKPHLMTDYGKQRFDALINQLRAYTQSTD